MEDHQSRPLRDIAAEANCPVIKQSRARRALDITKITVSVDAPFGVGPERYEVVGSFLTDAIRLEGGSDLPRQKELRTMCGHSRL